MVLCVLPFFPSSLLWMLIQDFSLLLLSFIFLPGIQHSWLINNRKQPTMLVNSSWVRRLKYDWNGRIVYREINIFCSFVFLFHTLRIRISTWATCSMIWYFIMYIVVRLVMGPMVRTLSEKTGYTKETWLTILCNCLRCYSSKESWTSTCGFILQQKRDNKWNNFNEIKQACISLGICLDSKAM